MNNVTPRAGALTKRTTCNRRQTNQNTTNRQQATQRDTTDKQTAEAGTPRQAQQNTPPETRRAAPGEQHHTQTQGNPVTALTSSTVTGHPVVAYAPTPPRAETTPPPTGAARSRPARSNTGSGQTVDKREIPEHPLEGASAHAARQPREHGPDK